MFNERNDVADFGALHPPPPAPQDILVSRAAAGGGQCGGQQWSHQVGQVQVCGVAPLLLAPNPGRLHHPHISVLLLLTSLLTTLLQ